MNNKPTDGHFHPFNRTLDQDLALLAAGEEIAWWDEPGRPAPWPQDFLYPDSGWEPASPMAGPPSNALPVFEGEPIPS